MSDYTDSQLPTFSSPGEDFVTTPGSDMPPPSTPVKRNASGAGSSAADDELPPPESTPKKRSRGRPKKINTEDAVNVKTEDSEGSTPATTPKKAKASPKVKSGDAAKKAKFPPTPRTESEMTECDRKLVEMKESGTKMQDINVMWQELTGFKPGGSTLNNRYHRIKDNMARLDNGDDEALLNAVEQLEKDRFGVIADIMHNKFHTKKYNVGFITKEYKRIMDEKSAGTLVLSTRKEGSETAADEDMEIDESAVKNEPADDVEEESGSQ